MLIVPGRRWPRLMATVVLVVSALVVPRQSHAHGNCTVFASYPHRMDGRIQASGRYGDCDRAHAGMTIQLCFYKLDTSDRSWERIDCLSNHAVDAKDVYATNVRGPACSNGKWRTRVRGLAFNDYGALTHADGRITGGPATISC